MLALPTMPLTPIEPVILKAKPSIPLKPKKEIPRVLPSEELEAIDLTSIPLSDEHDIK